MMRHLLSLLLLVWGILPIMSESRCWNASRGYHPFRHATATAIDIHNTTPLPLADGFSFPHPLDNFVIAFRCANLTAHPHKKQGYTDASGARRSRSNPEWSLLLWSPGDTLRFTIATRELDNMLSSAPALTVQATASGANVAAGSATAGPLSGSLAEAEVTSGVDFYSGPNQWRLIVEGDVVRLCGGNRNLSTILTVPAEGRRFTGFAFESSPAAHIAVSDVTLTDGDAGRKLVATQWADRNHLADYLAYSKDDLEGYYVLFDRNLEETLLQMGGDYRLAVVRHGEAYDIIYLDGAKVNGALWHPGMLKGRLIPGAFPGIYDVEWIDAEGLVMSHSLKAQTGDGGVLTLQFPYQQSVVRLRKYEPK